MPRNDQAAIDQAMELDANRVAMRRQEAELSTPPFSAPVPAREYNVTIQMMQRVFDDLSEGQAVPEFEKAKGDVDVLPPEVFMAIQVLASFPGTPLQIDPVEIASSPEAFADFAGVLSSLRRDNGSRPKRDPEQLARIPTSAELGAVDSRAAAGAILDGIRE